MTEFDYSLKKIKSLEGVYVWRYRNVEVRVVIRSDVISIKILNQTDNRIPISLSVACDMNSIRIQDLQGNGDESGNQGLGFGRLIVNIAWQIIELIYPESTNVTGSISRIDDTNFNEKSNKRRLDFWRSTGLDIVDLDENYPQIRSVVGDFIQKNSAHRKTETADGIPLDLSFNLFIKEGDEDNIEFNLYDVLKTFPNEQAETWEDHLKKSTSLEIVEIDKKIEFLVASSSGLILISSMLVAFYFAEYLFVLSAAGLILVMYFSGILDFVVRNHIVDNSNMILIRRKRDLYAVEDDLYHNTSKLLNDWLSKRQLGVRAISSKLGIEIPTSITDKSAVIELIRIIKKLRSK